MKIYSILGLLLVTVACTPKLDTVENPATIPNAYPQQFDADGNPVVDPTAIKGGQDRIVLSDYTQAQQKIDREAYAREFEQYAQQRVVINDVYVPETGGANVAAFARASTNAVGQKVYDRDRGRSGSCRKYSTSADAQRAFLEAGGPIDDRLNLDRDGDGFACEFDPTPYRQLR